MNTSLFWLNARHEAGDQNAEADTSPDVACVGRPAVGSLSDPRPVQTIPTLGIGVNDAKMVSIGDENDQVI